LTHDVRIAIRIPAEEIATLIAVHVGRILYGMNETKLTVRLSRETLESAKRYARDHETTLTRLVVTHLEHLSLEDDVLASARVARRLAGSLAPEASTEEYRDYLGHEYG
jgi:hypothetical protein